MGFSPWQKLAAWVTLATFVASALRFPTFAIFALALITIGFFVHIVLDFTTVRRMSVPWQLAINAAAIALCLAASWKGLLFWSRQSAQATVIVEQIPATPTPIPFAISEPGPYWVTVFSNKKGTKRLYLPDLRFWYLNYSNNTYTVVNYSRTDWDPVYPEWSQQYKDIFARFRAQINRSLVTREHAMPLTIGPQEKSVYFDLVSQHHGLLDPEHYNLFHTDRMGLYFVGTAVATKGDQEVLSSYCGVLIDLLGELQAHRGPPEGCQTP